MSRVLRVARATVAPGREAEYAQLLAKVARVVRARGARFWVFRSEVDPDHFLEFREAARADLLEPDAAELALQPSLDAVARYAVGRDERWTESDT